MTVSKIKERVSRHRQRQDAAGLRRVDVVVPEADVDTIRALAQALREGGRLAAQIRKAAEGTPKSPFKDGRELVAFFRASPFVGEDFWPAREPGSRPPIDFD
jgi:hypothetical protein